jgi:hypothetical protein
MRSSEPKSNAAPPSPAPAPDAQDPKRRPRKQFDRYLDEALDPDRAPFKGGYQTKG